MKIAAVIAGGLVAVLLIAMVAIGAIAAVIFPAAVTAVNCTGPVAAMPGTWRPPLLSAYTEASGFGMRYHPVLRTIKLHTGIDLVASGAKTIVAAADGTVTTRGYNTAYGHQVIVDHGGGISTRYAHMAAPGTVSPGQKIDAGTKLGTEGATGYATGVHLHFEVIKNDAPTDPKPFMASHGAPLNGRSVTTTAGTKTLLANVQVEGGIGFDLPAAGNPRRTSLTTKPLPIPADIKKLYTAAADKYKLPWTLLAAIGMEETGHGRNTNTSTAGAQGLMQFMPATWTNMGVDGDGDGRADIVNDADSIYSAANYLTKSGVSKGADGVRRALFTYNHADWYVNDVLHYAQAYGGGTVLGGVEDCGSGQGTGNPNLPSLTTDRLRKVLTWAKAHASDRYVFGGKGPHAWDCSSFTQAAYRQIGITLPRTAGAQRDWLAKGNGYRVKPGQERPGDLIFWDSFLGPNQIGHVAMVADPATKTTIEARNSRAGVGTFTYNSKGKHIYQIWRVGNLNTST